MYSTKSPKQKEELHYVALQFDNFNIHRYINPRTLHLCFIIFWGFFNLQNEIILKSSLLITADILTWTTFYTRSFFSKCLISSPFINNRHIRTTHKKKRKYYKMIQRRPQKEITKPYNMKKEAQRARTAAATCTGR